MHRRIFIIYKIIIFQQYNFSVVGKVEYQTKRGKLKKGSELFMLNQSNADLHIFWRFAILLIANRMHYAFTLSVMLLHMSNKILSNKARSLKR